MIMNTMKATHYGTCQACGRVQKLPGPGVLSKHGYNVAHGFFSGVCAGSGELPYELSCEKIKGFIAAAETQISQLRITGTRLEERATEPKAWVHTYCRNIGYTWTEVTIIESIQTGSSGSSWATFHYEFEGKPVRVENYNRLSLLDLCTRFNRQFSERTVRSEIAILRRYMRWQEDRIIRWIPNTPLIPITTKPDTKVGFKPNTEERYGLSLSNA